MVGTTPLGEDSIGNRSARDYWRVNGMPVALDPIDEIREFEALEITFQVPLEVVQQVLRPLRKDAGSVEILNRSDGGFVAVDTADGSNTHKVEPPAARQSVRRQIEWHVDDYSEEMLDQQGEKFEVELDLIPAQSKRQYSGHDAESGGADDWVFEFDAGTVATTAVSSQISETPTDGVETLGLDLVLGPTQVRKIEESARKLGAVRVVEQHDGSARAVDNSPNRVNVFRLTPPDGGDKTITPGYYVVSAVETSWTSAGAYEVALDAMSIDGKPAFSESFSNEFDKTPQ